MMKEQHCHSCRLALVLNIPPAKQLAKQLKGICENRLISQEAQSQIKLYPLIENIELADGRLVVAVSSNNSIRRLR